MKHNEKKPNQNENSNQFPNEDGWNTVLDKIRTGKVRIVTDKDGVPTLAIGAALYELYELLEAMASGYNALVTCVAEQGNKLKMIQTLLDAYKRAEAERKSKSDV